MKPLISALACGLALAACAAPTETAAAKAAAARLEPATLGHTQRVHQFGALWLASQPAPGDFELARAEGVRSVIDLRPDAETPELDERKLVAGLGLEYFNPAWAGPNGLSDDAMLQSLDALRRAPRPTLLHCSSGNRVGAIWLAYRVLEDGLSFGQALTEAGEVGLKSPELVERVRDYLERHPRAAR